jgi:hypothetical protein
VRGTQGMQDSVANRPQALVTPITTQPRAPGFTLSSQSFDPLPSGQGTSAGLPSTERDPHLHGPQDDVVATGPRELGVGARSSAALGRFGGPLTQVPVALVRVWARAIQAASAVRRNSRRTAALFHARPDAQPVRLPSTALHGPLAADCAPSTAVRMRFQAKRHLRLAWPWRVPPVQCCRLNNRKALLTAEILGVVASKLQDRQGS